MIEQCVEEELIGPRVKDKHKSSTAHTVTGEARAWEGMMVWRHRWGEPGESWKEDTPI